MVSSAGISMDTLSEVEKFLAILFAPTDLVEVRAFHRERAGGCTLQEWRPVRELGGLVPRISLANTDGESNVYLGINPRIREGGKEEDVALARCLFADWDDVQPDQLAVVLAEAELPQPTLIVDSGHGVHAYWLLTEPITDMALWRAAQAAIIRRAKSDPKIKDPPRVMRLPGFMNWADPEKDEDNALCRIIAANAEAAYGLEEVAGKVEPERPPQRSVVPSNPMDQLARLSRSTLQFLSFGARDGERNQRLFSAACDMAGCGLSIAEVVERVSPKALAAGLSAQEIDDTIHSAFNKPRQPAAPDPTEEIASALQRDAVPAMDQPRDLKPNPLPLVLPPSMRAARIRISNVVDADGPDGEAVRYYMPLPQIADAVREATGGWPKRAGGVLFAVNHSDDPIPGLRSVRWIKKNEELFAWLGHFCDIRWCGSETKHAVNKGTRLNPPTKLEMFAYLKDGPVDNFRAVEVLPHHPLILDLYYLPCQLPPLLIPVDDTPTPLVELVNRFNPETELDRKLMFAALLTPGWGGPPGARPAFVFTSDHGRGTGKTTSANVMAEVWGGAMTIGAREEFEQVKKRLLGDDSLAMRVCLMDNVKGRLSGSDIEGLITAKMIDGWKPYVGQASRPNLMTWYLTANSPSLSRDLADRSVVIKVGKQAHTQDFLRWATDWVRQHRAMILAELFDVLKVENQCNIRDDCRDRWGAWQDAILTRFEDGNDLAQLITSRRGDVDSDQEDAEEIAACVVKLVSEHYTDHEERRIHISYQQLYNRLVRDGVTDKNFGPRNVITWVKDRCASGPLYFLQPKKTNSRRGWLYTGPSANLTYELTELPESAFAGTT